MHRQITNILITLSFFTSTLATGASARIPAQASAQPASRVVCLPGIYLADPGDCIPAGPSAYLTRMAEKGITLPIPPLTAASIDPTLSQVNVRYGEVRTPNAPVYGSLEDAVAKNKNSAVQRLNGNTVYISYIQEEIVNGKRFYMIDFGAWMTANDVSRIGVLPRSLGMTFQHTPSNTFGWVLNYFAPGPIETKRTPGLEIKDYTGHILNLYDLVWVFAEEQVGEETWAMIAPDEWVLRKYVARVIPNTNPPEGITGERWIEINLYDQTLAVYDKRQMVLPP